MADLKAGTTIGGMLVWTQGNFPLVPTGNTLMYKTFKVYSENDKPQAADNDFVSKAGGGIYLNPIAAPSLGIQSSDGEGQGISLYNGAVSGSPNYGIHFSKTAIFGVHAGIDRPWATYFQHLGARYPWIFRTLNTSGTPVNVASVSPDGVWTGPDIIIQNATPTAGSHATRKDWVDGQINTVTNNANSRVLRAGDTMTGNLTVPNLISNNVATAAAHVPRLDQVVQKATVLDYGTF